MRNEKTARAANQGAEVVFLINGPDEEEAYKQLQEFCETNL